MARACTGLTSTRTSRYSGYSKGVWGPFRIGATCERIKVLIKCIGSGLIDSAARMGCGTRSGIFSTASGLSCTCFDRGSDGLGELLGAHTPWGPKPRQCITGEFIVFVILHEENRGTGTVGRSSKSARLHTPPNARGIDPAGRTWKSILPGHQRGHGINGLHASSDTVPGITQSWSPVNGPRSSPLSTGHSARSSRHSPRPGCPDTIGWSF
jgi:hypothetical protein